MNEKSCFLIILGITLVPILSAFIVRIPLTMAPPPNTLSSAVVELLRELQSNIESLPDEAFGGSKKAAQYRAILSSKIETVIKQVEVGALQGAIEKLNDIADKIARWVVEPWMTVLAEKIAEIIGLLGLYV